jgi:hypothetical protein
MADVYELTKVIREGGNTMSDDRRIGRKYREHRVEEGFPATMYHADGSGLVLLTSPVEFTYKNEIQIVFATANTVYFFRKVID